MDSNHASVSDHVTFQCGNGGVLTIIGDDGETDLNRFGDDGAFAYYDDLHIDAHDDMIVDVAGEFHTEGTVQHVTGDPIMRFKLAPQEPSAKADIRLTGLARGEWYRLRFGGVLAATAGGRAHGRTNDFGRLDFLGVKIPNE